MKRNIFAEGDWTGRISLIRFKKLACARTRFREGGAPENPASQLPKPIRCGVTVIPAKLRLAVFLPERASVASLSGRAENVTGVDWCADRGEAD